MINLVISFFIFLFGISCNIYAIKTILKHSSQDQFGWLCVNGLFLVLNISIFTFVVLCSI